MPRRSAPQPEPERIYSISPYFSAHGPGYADVSPRGTWAVGELCPRCGSGTSDLVPPLLIEWEKKPHEIGDFSWYGSGFVVTARVRDALLAADVRGVLLRPVEEVTARPRKGRSGPTYTGPLWDLQSTETVLVDVSVSEFTRRSVCELCRATRYRCPGNCDTSLIVATESRDPAMVFRVNRRFYPDWTGLLCNQAVADLITQQGFTNIALEPIGRLHRTKAAYKAALKSLEIWANDAVGG